MDAIPGASSFGPPAFNATISREAALLKRIEHPAAGDADMAAVPSIGYGNALFKTMHYFVGVAPWASWSAEASR